MDEIEDQEDAEVNAPGVRSTRDEMVAALARYLSKKRLANVTKMAAPGYPSPKSHNGGVPEIEAVTSMVGTPIFGVVEDCESYSLPSSSARLDALSRVANAAVFLVVPKACHQAAKRLIEIQFAGRDITVLPYGRRA